MGRSKGGRGKTTPYESKSVKVPEPMQSLLVGQLDHFYEHNYQVPVTAVFYDEAVQIAQQILKQKKGAKVSIKSLLKKLYGVDSVDL